MHRAPRHASHADRRALEGPAQGRPSVAGDVPRGGRGVHQGIKAHEKGWKNLKHGTQWRTTLATFAYPVIGDMLVRDVTTPNVLSVIEPIWLTKNTTAARLRGRIETVLDYATARGQRSGENPARWRSHLVMTLE